MRKYKEGMAKYNAILAEFPDVREALAPGSTAPIQQPKPVVSAKVSKELSLEEIYEKYHDAEQTVSMGLIEKEVNRCTEIQN
jgi:hypothetical protein